jgi:uncharacterized protein (DUF2062 family)
MQQLLQSSRVLAAQDKVLEWLRCGLSPRQLAFTLALGFAIGCIPLLGVTTGICALAALLLRLNMPAIQAANWLAMPLQLILLFPFIRLGQWIFPGTAIPSNRAQLLSRIESAPLGSLMAMAGLFGHALVAWVIVALPLLLVLTLLLTPLMGRFARLVSPSAAYVELEPLELVFKKLRKSKLGPNS